MESVVRGLVVYFFLLLIFRIAGRRTLSETTNFNLVLLLIISETTQQAMVDEDHSITNGFLLILTLVGATMTLAFLKQKFPRLDRLLEGTPVCVLQRGKPLLERMRRERIDDKDIMEAARRLEGLERLDQVKYAVMERNGEITVVPFGGT